MSSLKEIKQTAYHSEALVFRDSYCSCTFQDWFNCKCILSPSLFFLPSTPSSPSIIFPSLCPSLPVHPLPCILRISPPFPSLLLFHSSLSFHWRSLTKVMGELAFSFPSAHVSKLASYNQLQFCLEGHLERLSNIYHNTLFMNRWVHCTSHHSLHLTPHHAPHYTTPHQPHLTSPYPSSHHSTPHPTTHTSQCTLVHIP